MKHIKQLTKTNMRACIGAGALPSMIVYEYIFLHFPAQKHSFLGIERSSKINSKHNKTNLYNPH